MAVTVTAAGAGVTAVVVIGMVLVGVAGESHRDAPIANAKTIVPVVKFRMPHLRVRID
jgi:hypothetical protein